MAKNLVLTMVLGTYNLIVFALKQICYCEMLIFTAPSVEAGDCTKKY